MLFNKVLDENEKCAFIFTLKQKELFGQPNALVSDFEGLNLHSKCGDG